MQLKLWIWIRQAGTTQRAVAAKAGRSDAWLSKIISRPFAETTDEDRALVRAACEGVSGRKVKVSDLFEPADERFPRKKGRAA